MFVCYVHFCGKREVASLSRYLQLDCLEQGELVLYRGLMHEGAGCVGRIHY